VGKDGNKGIAKEKGRKEGTKWGGGEIEGRTLIAKSCAPYVILIESQWRQLSST